MPYCRVLGSMMIPKKTFRGELNKMTEYSILQFSSNLRSSTIALAGPMGIRYRLPIHSAALAFLWILLDFLATNKYFAYSA